MRHGLKRLRQLLACLALPSLFAGCTGMMAGGMVLEHAVSYPMRSPEFILRDLGGNHYLLAQWDVPLNANPQLRVRYHDRGTGLLSPLPETVAVFRQGYVSNLLGALRYESDSPQRIAFFANRSTGYNLSCEHSGKAEAERPPAHLCGYMDIVLSLDGGHSFAWRRIRIPTAMGRGMISPRHYEFAIVRDDTLYLGLYVGATHLPGICCHSPDGNLMDRNGVVRVRRFEGKAVADDHDVFLSVLAMPLPDTGGKPLPAEQIPQPLSADALTGQALLAFDPGRPMARFETPPAAAPRPPIAQYRRADRQAYIESLRAEYPEWAAHQTLDDIPRRQQWMTSEELNALRARQTPRGDDPIEWVRFDRPAGK